MIFVSHLCSEPNDFYYSGVILVLPTKENFIHKLPPSPAPSRDPTLISENSDFDRGLNYPFIENMCYIHKKS